MSAKATFLYNGFEYHMFKFTSKSPKEINSLIALENAICKLEAILQMTFSSALS